MRFISFLVIITFIITSSFNIANLNAITIKQEADKEAKKTKRGQSSEKDGQRVDEKKTDPRLACLLSVIVPGAGHVYIRKDVKGIGFCLGAGAGYTASAYFFYNSVLSSGGSGSTGVILSGVFLLIATIVHIVGVVEVYSDAKEINEKARSRKGITFGPQKSNSPYITEIIREK